MSGRSEDAFTKLAFGMNCKLGLVDKAEERLRGTDDTRSVVLGCVEGRAHRRHQLVGQLDYLGVIWERHLGGGASVGV